MIPKEDTEGKTTTTTEPTIVHNFQSTDNKVIVSSDHPTNEQEFKQYIEEHPEEAPIIEETKVIVDDKTGDILTKDEKKEIIQKVREEKAEEEARRKEDNAVLDSMGLKDAYGDTWEEDGNIYTKSLRTGDKVDIGDVRSDAVVFGSYGYAESGSGVRILDPSTGISEDGVFEDGEWKPQGTKHLLEEPTVSTRTKYDPFQMMAPVTDNYGKLTNKPAWVLGYDTPVIYEPGSSGYELAVGPTGKKLDMWGGYDPKRGVFVVSGYQRAGDIDTLGEVMIGSGSYRTPELYLEQTYGKSRLDEFRNYSITPITKRTFVDVTDSKQIITYDIGSYDIADFNVDDFKKGGDVTLKEKLPSSIMVGGDLNNNNNVTPVVKKDVFGQTPDAMFYFDPQIEKKIQWGGKEVKVDTLSYGLFEFGNKINEGATALSNMLPAGHVRNIGGAVIKTGAGIPSGLIMAGSAVVMETEIAAQSPAAVVDVFKGTPGYMVEQKQQAYADNLEESLASDALAVGIIGYGGFKMAGVKTLTSPKAIKAPELGVKGSVESYTQPKTSLFKSNIEGGYKRVITLKDGTKAYTSEVVARFAPTEGESAAMGESFVKGDNTIRSVSKADVFEINSKRGVLDVDATDGPASPIEYTPKRMTPTVEETAAEVARMNTPKMRLQRDAAKYWNKLTDLEKGAPNLKGDLTGIEPNIKSSIQGIEIEPKVYDYSRLYPSTVKPSNVKITLLDAYLKNSRTRVGDVILKQKLILEPPRVESTAPKINTGSLFKIGSPGILPSVGKDYKLPQKIVAPQSLVFDTSDKISPVIKPSSKISSKLVTGSKSSIKYGVKTDTKTVLATGLIAGTMTLGGLKAAQSHAYRTPKYYELGGGNRFTGRKPPAGFDKHLWRNAGVLSEYVDGLNMAGLFDEPKKRKKSKRKGGKR